MDCYVLGLEKIDRTQVAVAGGKGAHLGELSRMEGIRVPAGFCVNTNAFERIVAEEPSFLSWLDRLSRVKAEEREEIRSLSAEIRAVVEGIELPDDLAAAITRALTRLGEQAAYAVRSSATAEDLPTASFAGQQDTYLNVVGTPAILRARQPLLGFALHGARRHLPPAQRRRPPKGPHGRDRAADGIPARSRHAVHGRSRYGQSEGHLRGGQLRPGRGPGLRPGERRRVQGARRSVVSKAIGAKQQAIDARRRAGWRNGRSGRSGRTSQR